MVVPCAVRVSVAVVGFLVHISLSGFAMYLPWNCDRITVWRRQHALKLTVQTGAAEMCRLAQDGWPLTVIAPGVRPAGMG